MSEPIHASLTLSVNGDAVTVAPGTTVLGLVSKLELGERKIAVAVNGDVVPRASHDTHSLVDGDEVEILEAVGGG